MEICGAGPDSTCKVHEFVSVRVIVCLLSFYLFRLATRNGSSHCIGPKKQATLLDCFFSLFARLFIWLVVSLFVCLVLFSFVSFLVSLLVERAGFYMLRPMWRAMFLHLSFCSTYDGVLRNCV